MTEILFHHVSKLFGTSRAVTDFCLRITPGELIVVVGPSGCGKSTLLRLVAGLEEITSGTLMMGSVRMNDVPAAQRGVAMVFQNYALYPHMTVRDNLAFALTIARRPKPEIRAAVERIAQTLDLTACLDRLPGALSGGQRQRVAIGRAMLRNPRVYLFDEPLSNLDPALRVTTRTEIARLKERMPDATMIYVTHDQVEAMTLADRIVVMEQGAIRQVGTPLDLYARPRTEFVARFIGSPAMNLLPGTVVRTGPATTVALAQGAGVTVPIPTQPQDLGRAVRLGVRPEDLTPAGGCASIVSGRVLRTEPLGDVTLLQVAGPEGTVMARVPGTRTDLRHTDIALAADASRLHLFQDGLSLLCRDKGAGLSADH